MVGTNSHLLAWPILTAKWKEGGAGESFSIVKIHLVNLTTGTNNLPTNLLMLAGCCVNSLHPQETAQVSRLSMHVLMTSAGRYSGRSEMWHTVRNFQWCYMVWSVALGCLPPSLSNRCFNILSCGPKAKAKGCTLSFHLNVLQNSISVFAQSHYRHILALHKYSPIIIRFLKVWL